jgi:hypothetical protein
MTGDNQTGVVYQDPQYAPPQAQYAPPPQNYGAGYQAGGVYQQHTTVGVNQDDTALIIQIAILIVGWFCCCVWAAGFAYVKHPNPNVALMAKINAGLFLFGICIFCCSMVVLVFYFIIIAIAV